MSNPGAERRVSGVGVENPDLPKVGSLIQYVLRLGCGRLLRFFCLILVVKHTRDYFDLNQFNSVFYRCTFLFSFNSRHNSISFLFHLSRLLTKSGEGSQP